MAPPRPVKEKPEAVPAALEVAVGARLVPPRLKPVVPVLCVAPPNEKPLALVAAGVLLKLKPPKVVVEVAGVAVELKLKLEAVLVVAAAEVLGVPPRVPKLNPRR